MKNQRVGAGQVQAEIRLCGDTAHGPSDELRLDSRLNRRQRERQDEASQRHPVFAKH